MIINYSHCQGERPWARGGAKGCDETADRGVKFKAQHGKAKGVGADVSKAVRQKKCEAACAFTQISMFLTDWDQ